MMLSMKSASAFAADAGIDLVVIAFLAGEERGGHSGFFQHRSKSPPIPFIRV